MEGGRGNGEERGVHEGCGITFRCDAAAESLLCACGGEGERKENREGECVKEIKKYWRGTSESVRTQASLNPQVPLFPTFLSFSASLSLSLILLTGAALKHLINQAIKCEAKREHAQRVGEDDDRGHHTADNFDESVGRCIVVENISI